MNFDLKHDVLLRQNKNLIVIVSISFLLLFVLLLFGVRIKLVYLSPAVLLLTLFLFDFRSICVLFIISIFIHFSLFGLQVSVLISFFLLISFLLSFYDIKQSDFKNPLLGPLLFYFVCVLPSLLNSVDVLTSIIKSYQLAALFIVVVTLGIGIDNHRRFLQIIYTFLFMVLTNSIYVLYLGIATGERVFGFPSIFFVDFVGLGTLVAVTIFIFSNGSKKFIFSIISGICLIGLVFTQTRNAWISFLVSFLFIIFFLLLSRNNTYIHKRKIFTYLVFIIFSGAIIFMLAGGFSSGLSERVTDLTQSTTITDNPVSALGNSLITRIFI